MSTENRPEVVVVTGASAGIGRATARAFAEGGAHVGLLASGRGGLEGARRDVEAAGGRALVIPTDVSDAEAVEAAAERVERELGPIDVWVNNAMTSVFSPTEGYLCSPPTAPPSTPSRASRSPCAASCSTIAPASG